MQSESHQMIPVLFEGSSKMVRRAFQTIDKSETVPKRKQCMERGSILGP